MDGKEKIERGYRVTLNKHQDGAYQVTFIPKSLQQQRGEHGEIKPVPKSPTAIVERTEDSHKVSWTFTPTDPQASLEDFESAAIEAVENQSQVKR